MGVKLKRTHNYYYQVQQQLFILPERKFNDFVVCGIDQPGNANIVSDQTYSDSQHCKTVMAKLEPFWRICVLPELLGRRYTRKCYELNRIPSHIAICFSRGQLSDDMLSCSNSDCPCD